MTVSAILKQIMKDKKLKAQDVADEMEISRQTLYNTFNNDRRSERDGMTYENVVRYANALGCDVIIRDRTTGKEY